MVTITPRPASLLVILGGLSLAAVLAGAAVCALTGVPTGVWARNLVAWLVGGILACVMWRSGAWLLPIMLILATLLLGLSFLGPDQMGVHRWIKAGPVSFNAAMLTLPAALISSARLGQKLTWPWAVTLAVLVMIALQPDRSQATAFGAGIVWLVTRSGQKLWLRFGAIVVAALAIAGAWLQPDPLPPVAEVEEILRLAWTLSPVLAVLALASLLLFSTAPAFLFRAGEASVRRTGEALSVYFLVSAAMPLVGAYPVPLVGVGMSPILGAWFAAGLLACRLTAGLQLGTTPTGGGSPAGR